MLREGTVGCPDSPGGFFGLPEGAGMTNGMAELAKSERQRMGPSVARHASLSNAEVIEFVRRYETPRVLTSAMNGAIALTDRLIHQQDIRPAALGELSGPGLATLVDRAS